MMVRDALVRHMRFRDRVCWASHATLAADTGLSERTVKRCLQRLRDDGVVERLDTLPSGKRVRTCVWRMTHGTTRIRRCERKCPTTPSPTAKAGSRTSRAFRTPHYVRGSAKPRATRGRWMSDHLPAGLFQPRTTAPSTRQINAADIVGAAVDTLSLHDVPVTGRARAMIGKQAKELLADGFPPQTVLLAAVTSLRRGAPQHMHFVAQDIAITEAGQRMTRKQYEQALDGRARTFDPIESGARARLLDALGFDA